MYTTVVIAVAMMLMIAIGRCFRSEAVADEAVLKSAEKNVGSILPDDLAIGIGTNDGVDDGAVDGMMDKFSKEAMAPSSSSVVIPTEPTDGFDDGTGDGTTEGCNVVGALVTGGLVIGELVMGGLVTGGLVTGGLVTGAGVDGITTGGEVDGGVVVVPPPFGSLPNPETRNVILSNADENVMSVIVSPVETIFPF